MSGEKQTTVLRREVPVRQRREEPSPFGPAVGALILVAAYLAAIATVLVFDA